MKSFALITALYLCSLSWISASGSEFQTVEVQPGEEVTLLCVNISKHPTQTDWFRLVNRTKPRCISSMYGSDGKASHCDGFRNRFEVTSNISTVFLTIKQVDFSDSGLYFCGFYIDTHTVIATATYLNVHEFVGESDDETKFRTKEDPDGTTHLMTVILSALAVFLTIVVIVLVVKIKKLETAVIEEPERNKNLGSDYINSAALKFFTNTIRSRRPASEREMETHVTYTASLKLKEARNCSTERN